MVSGTGQFMGMFGHIKWLAVALSLWLSTPLIARGMSFDQWLAADIPDSLAVELRFEPEGDGHIETYESVPSDTSTESRPRYLRVPARPIGGYLGDLLLQPHSSATPNGSVSVKIMYYQVLPGDLLDQPEKEGTPQHHPDLSWNQPMGLLDTRSRMRAVKHQQVFVIDQSQAAASARIPLVVPLLPFSWRELANRSLFSCCIEVTDARGSLLAREMPVEMLSIGNNYNQRGVAWVMDEPEADRAMRDFVGLQDCKTIKTFPPVLQPFSEVDALWLSQRALDDGQLPPDTIRKLVLLGLWVYGRDNVVSRLRSELSLRNDDQVLLGGIARLNKVSEQGLRRNKNYNNDSLALWDQYVPNFRKDEPFPLDNRKDLFTGHSRKFMIVSLCILFFFLLTTGIGLPIAFCVLKGPRRLIVWYAVPIFAAMIALAGYAAGNLILPRTMQSDITEYRFAYAGWPEVCCRSVARLLTYENPGFSWKLPAGSFGLTAGGYPAIERSTHNGLVVEDRDGVAIGVSGLDRGEIVIKESASFREIPLPVEITWHTNRPMLKALADLRSVHIWTGGAWRVVGSMQAGGETDPDQMATTNGVYGLPQRIVNALRMATEHAVYGDPDIGRWTVEERNFVPAFSNSWIVVGVQNDPVACRVDADRIEATERAVWVIQFPFESAPRNEMETVASTP